MDQPQRSARGLTAPISRGLVRPRTRGCCRRGR
jgi:hypothetical protein